MVAHPTDPEWETCRACLAPVLVELAVSQGKDLEDGQAGDSGETLAVKERWQALFWRARTWSSRRKHLSSCDRQSQETRRMAQSLLDANANSNKKAAAQREDKRRKPDGQNEGNILDAEVPVLSQPQPAVRRSRVKGANAAAAAAAAQQRAMAQQDLAVPHSSMSLSSSVSSASSSSGSFAGYRYR